MQWEQGAETVWSRGGIDREEARRQLLAETVATALHVSPDRIVSAGRGTAKIATARQLAIYLSCTCFGLSLTGAGRLFSRDRTTAAHACRRVEELRDDPRVDELVDRLEYQLALRLMDGEARL